MVGAGLQGDVGGGANGGMTSRCRVAQSHHLGVRTSGFLGVACADLLTAVAHEDTTDTRIGVGLGEGAFCQSQCVAEVPIRAGHVSGGLEAFFPKFVQLGG